MTKSSISIAGILIIIMTSVGIAHAQDGFFSDAQTLRGGAASLGVQSAIYTDLDNEMMLILRGGYGLNPGLTLHGKVGLFRDETYLGGHLEYQLAGEPSDPISFALLAGVYAFGDPGLKLGGVFSKRLGQLSLYSGLSFEPLFTEPDTRTPILVPVGMEVPIGRAVHLVLEADIAANDDADFYQALHIGVNFYF